MKAAGLVFLSKAAPLLTTAADGTHQLTLRVVSRDNGAHHPEPMTLFWHGEPAKQFASRHLANLTPGRPLQVDLHRLRVHVSGSYAEMQAEITAISLLPTRFEVAA